MSSGNTIATKLKLAGKWLIFPGMNLHARLRYKVLPNYFCGPSVNGISPTTLDAGSGNGMLAYRSYAKGRTVLGVSIKEAEVQGSRRMFNDYLGIRATQLRFDCCDLYDLDQLHTRSLGEIICSETLEHIRDHEKVCRAFWRLLRPGGVLHICAPNAEHPYNKHFPLDHEEKGGHVRAGYTERSYRELLEPLGFQVEQVVGLGGPMRQALNRRIKETQARFGAVAGLPLFLLALIVLPFERRDVNPPVPFSIYVKARKRVEPV